jgi:hypothetical protein
MEVSSTHRYISRKSNDAWEPSPRLEPGHQRDTLQWPEGRIIPVMPSPGTGFDCHDRGLRKELFDTIGMALGRGPCFTASLLLQGGRVLHLFRHRVLKDGVIIV